MMGAQDQSSRASGGFVAVYRRLLDHPLWTQLPAEWLKAWLFLLLRANHKPCTWWDGVREIEIPAGGLITSIEKLASGSVITSRQARGSLDYFERAGMVTRQTSNRHSIITITNWASYQFASSTDDTPNGMQGGKMTASKRHAGGQANVTPDGSSTTNKQLTSKDPRSPGGEHPQELVSVEDPPFGTLDELPEAKPAWGMPEKKRVFEEFWKVWPRRVAKAAAEKAWCRQAKSPEKAYQILNAVRAQLPQLTADLKFCPYAATWLHQERFEDDVEEMQNLANGPGSPYTPAKDDE